MKREINPVMAIVAVVVLLVIAGGVYAWSGAASTRSGVPNNGVHAAGAQMPVQQTVPRAN